MDGWYRCKDEKLRGQHHLLIQLSKARLSPSVWEKCQAKALCCVPPATTGLPLNCHDSIYLPPSGCSWMSCPYSSLLWQARELWAYFSIPRPTGARRKMVRRAASRVVSPQGCYLGDDKQRDYGQPPEGLSQCSPDCRSELGGAIWQGPGHRSQLSRMSSG